MKDDMESVHAALPAGCCSLLWRLEKISGLGNVFMGNFINKYENSLGRLVSFLADHFGNAFADLLFLLFAEGSCYSDIYIRHNDSLKNDLGVSKKINPFRLFDKMYSLLCREKRKLSPSEEKGVQMAGSFLLVLVLLLC